MLSEHASALMGIGRVCVEASVEERLQNYEAIRGAVQKEKKRRRREPCQGEPQG